MTADIYYTRASNLLDEGDYEIAFATFLSVLELSIQQLHKVKFVQQTIISPPVQYENAVALIRSSINQIEKITSQTKELPSITITPSPPPPPVPPKLSPCTSTLPYSFNKPASTVKKPTVPPKPRIPLPPLTIIDTTPIRAINRPTKISPFEYVKNKTELIEREEDKDDDDDDDLVTILENVLVSRPFIAVVSSENSAPVSAATTSIDQSSTKLRSRSWIVPSDETGDTIDVLSETIVNPSNLVPAQTSDSSFQSYYTTDYVPNIPAPPLLATYRKLQTRKDDLEKVLDESKKIQQPIQILQQPVNKQYHIYHQQQQLDLLLFERSNNVAAIRDTLEKVRTLYMSAMTIPSILQFSPHLTAYQLTVIESSIFRAIPCEALLSHSARTPHKKIVASTDFFNFVTRSIEHSILLPQDASCRAKVIIRWIKIATKLLALNNYQSLKAIVSALGTPPVERLRRTWEFIPKKHMSRLELLNTLMSESNNYRRYREHMGLERKKKHHQQAQQHHVWTKPVVPFLGVFIHDVTYLQCAAKGNTKDTRFQDVLNHMDAFQRAPEYPQKPPPHYFPTHIKNSNGNNNTNGSKKHIPNAITNAFHLGSSTKSQNTNRANTAALMGDDRHEETELELEQQLIIQYILIRPWVSEKTIDALSNLREPSKPKSATSPTSNSNQNRSFLSHNNSIISKSSSFIRFSAPQLESNQLLVMEPEPLSPNTPNNNIDESKKLLGFWPFRKSNDLNRNSINTPPEPTWSEEEDEDEDEEEEDRETETTMAFIDNRKDQYQNMIESQTIHYESIHNPNSTISLQIN